METPEKSEPGSSLIETLRLSELPKILEDIAQLGLDSALQDGLLRDIPIVKWVIGVGKTVVAVRDYFLIKKIWRFLAYGRRQIDYDDFLRISSSIDRAFIGDLNDLLAYFADEEIKDADVRHAKRNLYTSDFSDFYVITDEEFQEI